MCHQAVATVAQQSSKHILSTALTEETWSKSSLLYPVHTKLPSGKTNRKKVINVSHDKDMVCKLAYEETANLPEGTHPVFAAYNITGIADFARQWSSKGLTPKVHLSFHMDSSGIVSLASAEATVEEVLAETAQAEGAADLEAGASADEDVNEADASSSEEAEAAVEAKDVKRKVKTHRKRLRFTENVEVSSIAFS